MALLLLTLRHAIRQNCHWIHPNLDLVRHMLSAKPEAFFGHGTMVMRQRGNGDIVKSFVIHDKVFTVRLTHNLRVVVRLSH